MSNLHPNPLVYEATLVSTDSSSPPQSTTSTSLDDGYHPGDRRAGLGSRAVPPRNVFLRTLSNAQKWFKIEEGDRSCSWGYTASLMTAEFVGLSLLTFPSIFAQLGWLLGLFSIFFIMGCYVYTSTQIGKFCGEHGEVRDVVDIAFVVGGKYGSKARVVTTLFFLMNNIVSHLIPTRLRNKETIQEKANTVVFPLKVCHGKSNNLSQWVYAYICVCMHIYKPAWKTSLFSYFLLLTTDDVGCTCSSWRPILESDEQRLSLRQCHWMHVNGDNLLDSIVTT